MPEISQSATTNLLLRHATQLAQLAEQHDSEAQLLACLWMLGLARSALVGELLLTTPVAVRAGELTGLAALELIAHLERLDCVLPELNQLAEIERNHPWLSLAGQVTTQGFFPLAQTHSIASSQACPRPHSGQLLAACTCLEALIAHSRMTNLEW